MSEYSSGLVMITHHSYHLIPYIFHPKDIWNPTHSISLICLYPKGEVLATGEKFPYIF